MATRNEATTSGSAPAGSLLLRGHLHPAPGRKNRAGLGLLLPDPGPLSLRTVDLGELAAGLGEPLAVGLQLPSGELGNDAGAIGELVGGDRCALAGVLDADLNAAGRLDGRGDGADLGIGGNREARGRHRAEGNGRRTGE